MQNHENVEVKLGVNELSHTQLIKIASVRTRK